MSDRTYAHQYPYRGFIVAAYTENGKALGSFGDTPIFARYYVLDEFEQNVIPLDQWFWSPVDAYAAIDALHIANPTADKMKWGAYYERVAQQRRLARFIPSAHEALIGLHTASEDWTFNSGEECAEVVKRALGPYIEQLDKVGPFPRELL